MQTNTIWIVVTEQYYADSVSILAVCDTEENADKIKAESKLGSDVKIYEAEFNQLYPTI